MSTKIASDLSAVVEFVCWKHGLAESDPYIQNVLAAINSRPPKKTKQRTRRTCDQCQVEFPMYRKAQRFCSKACHVKYHNHAYSQLIREAKAIVARHKEANKGMSS